MMEMLGDDWSGGSAGDGEYVDKCVCGLLGCRGKVVMWTCMVCMMWGYRIWLTWSGYGDLLGTRELLIDV